MPLVDIHTIGAGGGSLAWLEAGGLRVGPQSAGADPGPACYGRGGTQPTVTDANLFLGRLDPGYFLGGRMALDEAAAAKRARGRRRASSGSTPTALAEGMLAIINARMADAMRTITVEQGIDPREFSLVAFGGAGPMHAVWLAEELEIGEVIVPWSPGTFSAWGMLQTDMRHDVVQSFYRPLAGLEPSAVSRHVRRARGRGLGAAGARGRSPRTTATSRARPTCATSARSTRSTSRSAADGLARRDRRVVPRRAPRALRALDPRRPGRVRQPARRRDGPHRETPCRRQPARPARPIRSSDTAPVVFDGSEHETPVLLRAAPAAGSEPPGPAGDRGGELDDRRPARHTRRARRPRQPPDHASRELRRPMTARRSRTARRPDHDRDHPQRVRLLRAGHERDADPQLRTRRSSTRARTARSPSSTSTATCSASRSACRSSSATSRSA